jgi:hypothetical protein
MPYRAPGHRPAAAFALRPFVWLPLSCCFAAGLGVSAGGCSFEVDVGMMGGSRAATGSASSSSSTGGGGTSASSAESSSSAGEGSTSAASAGSCGASGSSNSSSSAGGSGAGGSSSSSSSSGGSTGSGGGSCPPGVLIGAGDLLWTRTFPYLDPSAPYYAATPPCWPDSVEIAANRLGHVALALRFDSCNSFPSSNYHVMGTVSEFDISGNLVYSRAFVKEPFTPAFFSNLGSMDVDGLGQVVLGVFESYYHSYAVYLRNSAGLTAYAIHYSIGQTFPGNYPIGIHAVAGGGSGEALGVFQSYGTDFGGGPQVGKVLVKVDPAYHFVWSRLIPASPALGMKMDSAGNTWLAGPLINTLDFGCGPLSQVTSSDAYLVKLDPSGSCVFSRRIDRGFHFEIDASGDALIALAFNGTIDLGGGPLTSVGTADVAVAKLDPLGNHRWSKRFGGPGFAVTSLAIATDGLGDVLLKGAFSGTVDFGGGPVTAGTGRCDPDAFITKLAPSGALTWSKYLHKPGLISIAGDAGGAVTLASASPTFDLGSGPVLSTYGLALTKLAP